MLINTDNTEEKISVLNGLGYFNRAFYEYVLHRRNQAWNATAARAKQLAATSLTTKTVMP